jgi:antirestriction protein
MEAKLYVGTYGKYNAGRLHGKWLDLTEYSDKEEFLEACKEVHKTEHDPEYMFQDKEGLLYKMPKTWLSESHISDEVFEFMEAFEDDTDKGEAFLSWLSCTGYKGDFSYLITTFEEAYEGEYDSTKAYAEYLIDETGILDKMGDLSSYFDYEAYARDLFMSDYMYLDGVVYRNL